MANPWDRPDPEPVGDNDPQPTLAAVGSALTSWESMEETLADLFTLLLRAEAQTARAAYRSIIAHNVRRDAIGAVISVYDFTTPDDRARAVDFINRVGKLSGRRNDIAHGVVTGITHDNVSKGYYLVPSNYNTAKAGAHAALTGKYQYTSNQILQFSQTFRNLQHEIFNVLAKLPSWPQP